MNQDRGTDEHRTTTASWIGGSTLSCCVPWRAATCSACSSTSWPWSSSCPNRKNQEARVASGGPL